MAYPEDGEVDAAYAFPVPVERRVDFVQGLDGEEGR